MSRAILLDVFLYSIIRKIKVSIERKTIDSKVDDSVTLI